MWILSENVNSQACKTLTNSGNSEHYTITTVRKQMKSWDDCLSKIENQQNRNRFFDILKVTEGMWIFKLNFRFDSSLREYWRNKILVGLECHSCIKTCIHIALNAFNERRYYHTCAVSQAKPHVCQYRLCVYMLWCKNDTRGRPKHCFAKIHSKKNRI